MHILCLCVNKKEEEDKKEEEKEEEGMRRRRKPASLGILDKGPSLGRTNYKMARSSGLILLHTCLTSNLFQRILGRVQPA